MRVSEIRVKQIRVNQGLSVLVGSKITKYLILKVDFIILKKKDAKNITCYILILTLIFEIISFYNLAVFLTTPTYSSPIK